MLVTGTPGTGKTFWQFHLLWTLAKLKATVVLDWAEFDQRFLFTRWDQRVCMCARVCPEANGPALHALQCTSIICLTIVTILVPHRTSLRCKLVQRQHQLACNSVCAC